MDQFERQFEHLDVQTQTMDQAMSGVTTLSMPEVIIMCVCVIQGGGQLDLPLESGLP